jgi:hypothetical protein
MAVSPGVRTIFVEQQAIPRLAIRLLAEHDCGRVGHGRESSAARVSHVFNLAQLF